jgi:membrane protein
MRGRSRRDAGSRPPGGREREEPRGREADTPGEIPRRGWWDIALRLREKLEADNVALVAAGLALYGMLAVFPGLAALVAIYGLFASPAEITAHLANVDAVLPRDAREIFREQLQDLAGREPGALGIGLAISLGVALWSARRGAWALMVAMNVAYGERERRGFVRRNLVALGFTVASMLGFLFLLVVGIAVPVILAEFPLGPFLDPAINVARWGVLWAFVVLGLAVVYRYAPSRRNARWRWVSWGSTLAATFWLLGSLGFALYLRYFDTLGETYGAIGGVVVLLMWFFLSAYVIVLGAEINAEMEHQTKEDTTRDPRAPLGHRGAHMADTVGRRMD